MKCHIRACTCTRPSVYLRYIKQRLAINRSTADYKMLKMFNCNTFWAINDWLSVRFDDDIQNDRQNLVRLVVTSAINGSRGAWPSHHVSPYMSSEVWVAGQKSTRLQVGPRLGQYIDTFTVFLYRPYDRQLPCRQGSTRDCKRHSEKFSFSLLTSGNDYTNYTVYSWSVISWYML